MSVLIVPLLVFLVALSFSVRIIFLMSEDREISKFLGAARHTAWSAVGFSLGVAIIQSGIQAGHFG